jgi:hypothetical protein
VTASRRRDFIDDIEHTPPFGILGRIVNALVIKSRLRRRSRSAIA